MFIHNNYLNTSYTNPHMVYYLIIMNLEMNGKGKYGWWI